MTHLNTDVLIIGAGPAGLISALCLDQHQVKSIIVERRPDLPAHPKAHELSGRSIEILHGLGFRYDELAAEASPHSDASRVLFCDTIAEEFGCIDLNTGPGAGAYARELAAPFPYLNISQVELEKLMLQHAAAAAHTQLRWNHQWESFEQNQNGIVSRLTRRDTGETLTIASRYVICADGAGSRSRRALGIEMAGPERLRDMVNAYLEADFSGVVTTPGKLYFLFNPAVAGSVFVAHHLKRRWVFNTSVLPGQEVADFTPEVMTRLIHTALGRDDVAFTIKSMSSWRMTAQVAERFSCGRAFLVGDAAHRFPPTGGLGMNSGIGDAHNLGWKLAAVLQGRAPESLLATYEVERRPIARINCDESRQNYERLADIVAAFGLDVKSAERLVERLNTGPMSSLPSAGQDWIRRQMNRYGARVLAKYHAEPAVRERVIQAIAQQRSHFDRIGLELGYTYERGALLEDATPPVVAEDMVSKYTPTTRPGARFPHFWLDGNQRRWSSHTLLDPRRSTLILGARLTVPDAEQTLMAEVTARLRVQLRFLAAPELPPACLGLVHTRCEIEPDGALMVRPDGHVGWRQRTGVTLSAALLTSILEQCYGSESTASS